jgi:RNA polymerase sigma-70 factor, ECF subfamily
MDHLLAEAKKGSSRDFALFVRATHIEIWRFCLSVVGPSDADDATQDTYLAIWRAMGTFRGDSSARTWVYTIARRTALGTLHQRQRWGTTLDPGVAEAPTSAAGEAFEIRQLLAELDVDRRIAFVLTQMVGLSYAETADICACAVGTIRSRVSRARADLIDLLREPDQELNSRGLA